MNIVQLCLCFCSNVKLQLNEFIRDGKTVAELMNIGKQFLGQFSSIGVLTSILKITNWSKCQQLSAVVGLVPLMNRWKLQAESCQHIRKGIATSIENKHTDARV